MRFPQIGLSYLFSILAPVLFFAAQPQGTVKLYGNITDPSGAVISNANIEIKPECKCSDCPDPIECRCCPPQATVRSNSAGRYEVEVKPGTYTVRVSVPGFDSAEATVSVQSQDKRLDITLK